MVLLSSLIQTGHRPRFRSCIRQRAFRGTSRLIFMSISSQRTWCRKTFLIKLIRLIQFSVPVVLTWQKIGVTRRSRGNSSGQFPFGRRLAGLFLLPRTRLLVFQTRLMKFSLMVIHNIWVLFTLVLVTENSLISITSWRRGREKF